MLFLVDFEVGIILVVGVRLVCDVEGVLCFDVVLCGCEIVFLMWGLDVGDVFWEVGLCLGGEMGIFCVILLVEVWVGCIICVRKFLLIGFFFLGVWFLVG